LVKKPLLELEEIKCREAFSRNDKGGGVRT